MQGYSDIGALLSISHYLLPLTPYYAPEWELAAYQGHLDISALLSISHYLLPMMPYYAPESELIEVVANGDATIEGLAVRLLRMPIEML